ncbi:MAG TPA: hypothetical protein VG779_01905 [Actinomycetota bacterium]|nr:hypothetical protein [Actinomycetota bacterium]
MVLTRLGIKYLVLEAKRPGALAWNQRSVDAALEQAQRYADEQKVRSIAVSDGIMLYARDPIPGGYRDRALARLDQSDPPLDLWWLSMDGMYRQREDSSGVPLRLLPPLAEPTPAAGTVGELGLLHPKYKLPARCFAYVGSTADPKTWHLPYLLADGRPDPARLPKAIQAIVSNFRGTHLNSHTVPEAAVPEVLVTLARAARLAGKLPADGASSARAYVRLQEVLDQLGRLSEIAV